MPRPTKLTPDTQTRIQDALMTGATIEKVCAYVGVGTTTFYRWMEKGELAKRGNYREFWDAVTQAQASAHINATEALASGMIPSETEVDIVEVITETRIDAKTGKPYKYEKTIQRKSVTIHPGDWRAAESFLKRRDAANWSATLNVNIDVRLVQDAIKALETLGQDPAEVFRKLIERAKVKHDASADSE